MKKIVRYSLFVFVWQVWSSIGYCQTQFRDTSSRNPPSKIIPPTMNNYKEFKRSFPYRDLQSVYAKLANKNNMYTYVYSFEVDKNGRVVPVSYHDKNQYYYKNKILFAPIIQYIKKTFNRYSWKPGYEEICKKCKQLTFVRMEIFFETDENKISIIISTLDLYHSKIMYSFNVPVTGYVN